jgi:hypothetical protein
MRVESAPPVSLSTPTASETLPPPPPTFTPHRLDQDELTNLDYEARAMIMWGDDKEKVLEFLRSNGISHDEASHQVEFMINERTVTVRRNGTAKSLKGIALIMVPIVALIIFACMDIFPVKLFALTMIPGLYGGWLVTQGAFMFLSPASIPGDVGDH